MNRRSFPSLGKYVGISFSLHLGYDILHHQWESGKHCFSVARFELKYIWNISSFLLKNAFYFYINVRGTGV